MRTAMLGALIGAGLVIGVVGISFNSSEVFAQRAGGPSGSPSATGELIALSTVVNQQYQQLTVIDPKLRVMSVYHVELTSGNVKLCCVRNIHFDLQMEYFNGDGLSPQEIRAMLEMR